MSSLFNNRKSAYDILEELRELGIADEAILDYIICNNLTHAVAHQLMVETREEFLGDSDEDDVSELQGDESDFGDDDEDDFGDSDED